MFQARLPLVASAHRSVFQYPEKRKRLMKLGKVLSPFVLVFGLASGMLAMPQESAKQDMKDAGHSTKQAAKDTGSATKKTANKAGHTVKKDTKSATNKAAQKTGEGAQKVQNKTSPQ
jgi:hypothetical protein